MSRPLPSAVAALALLLTLSGCFGGSPAPSTEVDPKPETGLTPTPETVDPLATVTALVARPGLLELKDDAGAVVTTLDYLGDAAGALATLETVFGTAPQSEDYPGDSHGAPGVVHRWGGMELWQPQYEGEMAASSRSYYHPSFYVYFTAPVSGEVALLTDGGHVVGDPWAELLAESGLQTNPSGCSGPYLDYIEVPSTDPDGNTIQQRVSVAFRPSDDASTVKAVAAPAEVHDSCA